MYARLITASVQPNKLAEFAAAFNAHVLPAVSLSPGFKSLYLLQDAAQSQVAALVLWETEAEAVASIEGFIRDRLPKMAPLLTAPPHGATMEVVVRA
jgi:heme-degrading monooxygenase HmoA